MDNTGAAATAVANIKGSLLGFVSDLSVSDDERTGYELIRDGIELQAVAMWSAIEALAEIIDARG